MKSTTLATLALSILALVGAAPARAEVPFSSTAFSDVAEKVTPAVVNITTRRSRAEAVPDGHPLRELFGSGRRRMPPEMGAGSGVVVSAKGDIVTNNHVIEGADDILVTFSDKRELKAHLVGTDKPADLAFLKVDGGDKLPFVEFGDSSALRLGEIVLAIGNPFGVGQTVTMGIVSAKGRANVGIVEYEDFIQTDASINPGNSGGALINLKGELVGINTAILSRSGGAQGIGFAVPSNMVKPIRDQITENGRVRRGWLGVAIQDLTPDLARSMNLDEARGVLVSDVMEDGPAAKGHLTAGDVIVQVNDRPTPNAAQLRNSIALTKPGSKTKLSVVREGKAKELFVTLDEKKEDQEVSQSPDASEKLLAGLSIADLDNEARTRMKIPGKVTGAVVTAVEPKSAAERAGIEEGDVITAVGRERVKGAEDVGKLVAKDAKEILLRVYKRGVFTFVVLRR